MKIRFTIDRIVLHDAAMDATMFSARIAETLRAACVARACAGLEGRTAGSRVDYLRANMAGQAQVAESVGNAVVQATLGPPARSTP